MSYFYDYVFYHANCNDGFCAAWVAKNILNEYSIFTPQDHSKEFTGSLQDLRGKNVYILDFRFKPDLLRKICNIADKVVLIDHHKTTLEELQDFKAANFEFIFDINKSGGRLTWEYFHPNKVSPWLVEYTEDADLWRYALDYSQAVNAAISSYPMKFDTWDNLHRFKNVLAMEAEGRSILAREEQLVLSHLNRAKEITFDGHRVMIVNASSLVSKICERLAVGKPFSMGYFINEENKVVVSFRSDRNGMDVSEIAKKYGGGGHRNASGATMSLSQLEEILDV